ncbi:hypothetical protein KUM39_17055 [Streptomyces sp. J2-1]|nr:hypothetical protein [Streptomyces corallincola]
MGAYDEEPEAPQRPSGASGPTEAGEPSGARGAGDVRGAGDARGSSDARGAGDARGVPATGAPSEAAAAHKPAANPEPVLTTEPALTTEAVPPPKATEPSDPAALPEADAAPPSDLGPAPAPDPLPPRTGVAALSPAYQIGAAVVLAVVAVAACVHLAMVFLSLAPANTVTKAHGQAVEDWVYPEFEQNWKLFAPNPLQQNIAVQVRAELRAGDGGTRTTGWVDLSAQDGTAIDGSLLPSHTQQNELRRAWDFFVTTHGTDNRPTGSRGSLAEEYVRRIVVMRLYRMPSVREEGTIERVQVRSSTTNVAPPPWSRERVSLQPAYRELPWWQVSAAEAAGGVR